MKTINIFFFPFAGGSSYSYTFLKSKIDSRFFYFPIELPGRGTFIREPLHTNIHSLVDFIFNKHKYEFIGDYIFVGHSMGSTVSYLLLKKIIKEAFPSPLHIFVSGRGGPSVTIDEIRFDLPQLKFWSRIKELGGSPKEVLDNQDLMDFFEPILRADFQAIETYEYQTSEPLDIPITVLLGKDDKVTHNEALLWQRETLHPIDIRYFDGGHFFIFDHAKEIADIINTTVAKYISD